MELCWLRHCEVAVVGRKPIPWEDRFFEKVVEVDGCWMWLGAKINGYGYFRGPLGPELAHRTMRRRLRPNLPTNRRLRNKCGNRACINPEHWG